MRNRGKKKKKFLSHERQLLQMQHTGLAAKMMFLSFSVLRQACRNLYLQYIKYFKDFLATRGQ